MITFFTTAKDFVGKTKIAQVNALKSWGLCVENAEVIVFGASEGAQEISEQLDCIYQPNIKVSNQGIPLINDMFERASKLASNEICCFINADIIIYNKFAVSIIQIHKILRLNYLVVGQRQDIDFNQEIDFNSDWQTDLNNLVLKNGSIHPPTGSDFFVFPKGQYQMGDIPDLLVGRPGWDLWMIYNGRIKGFKVIDLSPTTMVVHQNHDYSHRKVKFDSLQEDEEALSNLSNLPPLERYIYTLPACNYYYRNRKIKLNFARGDLKLFFKYELKLRRSHPLVGFILKVFEASNSVNK